MSLRLLSRQKWIPGGFRFYQPELSWKAPRNVSFDQIVQAVIRARQGNPAQCAKHQWSLDYDQVANEVDQFNAKVCVAHGWNEYIQQTAIPTIPKTVPPNQSSVVASLKNAAVVAKELVAGARTLMEWVDSNPEPVSAELAEHRAIICSKCPINKSGDLTQWFTRPAAELIRRDVEKAQERKLATPRDDQIFLCEACHCPLKLKVHVPIDWITKRISSDVLSRCKTGKGILKTPEEFEQLKARGDCWIVTEAERL